MSKFAWLLLTGLALPALAAKTVTVDQMNQWLAKVRHKSDTTLAREIAGVQLSERATPTELADWEAEFSGATPRDALLALSDASQFLALPQNEILKIPPPGLQLEVAMLSRAVQNVVKTVGKLPDFFATRETLHFEETPAQPSNPPLPNSREDFDTRGGFSVWGDVAQPQPVPLHFAGRGSVVVTYRDGAEVPFARSAVKSKPQSWVEGLTTSGEFGPILSVVLGDALHGKLEWGYWEQQRSNPEAVFRYSVPRNQSHYTVQVPNFRPPVTLRPAYHGEIAIDPSTGVILRLTVIADPEPPYQRFQADVMVSYAPVAIGGRTYICPVKAVAISEIPVTEVSSNPKHTRPYAGSVQTELNDISFTNYHVFRTHMTILPGAKPVP